MLFGGSGVNLDGWETGCGESGNTGTAADTDGWDFLGPSRDPRLTNHPDERERPIQTKQSMIVWRGPMIAERKLQRTLNA